MSTKIRFLIIKLKKALYESAHFLYKKYLKAKSLEEDLARKELILNILLSSTIILYSVAIIYDLVHYYQGNYQGCNPIVLLIIFFILILIYIFARKGYSKISAHVFVIAFFVPTIYAANVWGADLPVVLLFCILSILMSGILINTKTAFILSSIALSDFIITSVLSTKNIMTIDRSWKNERPLETNDVIMYSIIIFIILAISWLSNREITNALNKAHKSETELQKEKRLLKIRIEEKTKELREIQAEEIEQLNRFAEFGRMSSGLFHDLVNPLTTVMLNIEKIKTEQKDKSEILVNDINQVFNSSLRMKDFINSARKQISPYGRKELFSPKKEITAVLEVLAYKASKNKVQLISDTENNIFLSGDPIRFNQIVTNLISNAIDSYDGTDKYQREVKIKLFKKDSKIIIKVSDEGKGMTQETIKKIFDSFFTTKAHQNSLGLGLHLIKKIIEYDFRGEITVTSKYNKGSSFIVSLPNKNEQ